jgi:hypothetical protein
MKIIVVKKVQKHDTRSCPFVIEGLPEPRK